jgi:predicted MFS family arabinose efflux permease
MGISEACYIPAALALIADYHRGATRSLATGVHMSGLYAGMALGGMGGWIAEHHGWSASFFWFGCVGVGYAIVLAMLLHDAPRTDHASLVKTAERPLETIRTLGRNGAVWLVALQYIFISAASWAFIAWMPTFLKERFHLTQTYAGFTATAYIQVASFATVLIGGAWADRWSRTQLRARAWVPMIALTLASPFVFMTARADVLWVAILGLVAFGAGRGCLDANMMPVLCQVADKQHRATSYGLLNFVGCTVGGVAAYFGGWLKEQKFDLSYLVMTSAFLVLASGLLLSLVRPTRRD